jgi:diaminopimelate epimerase
MRFAKLEGLGNDYLFTEDIPKNPARAARLFATDIMASAQTTGIICLPTILKPT